MENGKKWRVFAFLTVDLGKEEKVMEKLLKFDEVKEVHIITGEKDLIAVLEIEREVLIPITRQVSNFVRHKIAAIPNVKDTETLIPTNSTIKPCE